MAYNALKAIIDQILYDNTEKKIEASEVNNLLRQLTDSVGTLQLRGIATPEMNPGVIDQNCFYLAEPGTYVNFSNLTISPGKLGMLIWNLGAWSKNEIQLPETGKLYDEDFVPSNGQTEFVLSAIPSSNTRIWLFINNISYLVGEDFIVSSNTIIWLESFTIQSTDKIRIKYSHN